MSRFAFRSILAAAGVAALVALLGGSYHSAGPESRRWQNGGVELARPVLAQEATFLDREAGFAAWARLQSPINLDLARRRFKTIESETAQAIIGDVEVERSGAVSTPHVYVRADGWIAAYYFADQPAARAWHTDAVTVPQNFLAMAVTEVAATAGIPSPAINYYDFRYPVANRVVAVFGQTGETEVLVPAGIQVYEASLSPIVKREYDTCGKTGAYSARAVTLDKGSFQSFPYPSDHIHGRCGDQPVTIVAVYRQPE